MIDASIYDFYFWLAVIFCTITALLVLFKTIEKSDNVKETVHNIGNALHKQFRIMLWFVIVSIGTLIKYKMLYK